MSLGCVRIGSGSASRPGPVMSGGYLTDGRRLFRIVSKFATVGGSVFASLEDCRALEVQAYAPGELYAKLRAVQRCHQ